MSEPRIPFEGAQEKPLDFFGETTLSVEALAGGAHHGDDLLDGRRVRRVAHPVVARRPTGVEARQRGGRTATTGGIEQTLGHWSSFGQQS